MFEYSTNNILCIQASWLYDVAKIISYANYKQKCKRQQFQKIQTGGNGRCALICWETFPEPYKQQVLKIVGCSPYELVKKNKLIDLLELDVKAKEFFQSYTFEKGDQDLSIPEARQNEYIANASIFKVVLEIVQNKTLKRKALGGSTKVKLWQSIADAVAKLPKHIWAHNLPTNPRSFRNKINLFKKEGYISLIHKGYSNTNSEKINDAAKMWLLSRWADRVQKVANITQLFNEYNEQAKITDWKRLKEPKSIYNFLHSEDIQPMWYAHRFGELKAKEKFVYQHKTKLPSFRDSLWYSDGTKLNYYYLDADGKIATCQVYEVMDAFSEVFLGYHISKTENYEAQYFAYKMAAKVSGFRPYQISFDNQGGHKKLQSINFLNNLSRLSIKTQPYNGKSKTIESAFGRFQQQFMKKDWFFTGQNITTSKKESKANMEFILANKANLPTLNDIKEVYKKRREEWNAALHPQTRIPRIEMYFNSSNPQSAALTLADLVDLFWIERQKPVKASAFGITFQENKIKHTYMVHKDGLPDVEWLARNIDKPFHIKFDPADMSMIYLYEKTNLGLRFITEATIKIEISRGQQEQEEWEAGFIAKVEAAKKAYRLKAVNQMDQILDDHQATPEHYGLNSPSIKGLQTSKAQKSKTKIIKKQKQTSKTDIAELLKVESNADETNFFDKY